MTVEGQGDETISWCEGAMSLHDGPRDARMREREENGSEGIKVVMEGTSSITAITIPCS